MTYATDGGLPVTLLLAVEQVRLAWDITYQVFVARGRILHVGDTWRTITITELCMAINSSQH